MKNDEYFMKEAIKLSRPLSNMETNLSEQCLSKIMKSFIQMRIKYIPQQIRLSTQKQV